MEAVWLADRAAALVAYGALYLSVLTGVLYNAEGFGSIRDAARDVHIEVSVFALIMTLGHGVLGALDAWFVLDGQVPAPAYSTTYLLAGVVVGAGALFVLVVGVLGYLDAKRFTRPWSPQVVHAFTYGGFAFATIHAAAIGTDVAGLVQPVLVTTTSFLVYVLLLRLFQTARREGTPA